MNSLSSLAGFFIHQWLPSAPVLHWPGTRPPDRSPGVRERAKGRRGRPTFYLRALRPAPLAAPRTPWGGSALDTRGSRGLEAAPPAGTRRRLAGLSLPSWVETHQRIPACFFFFTPPFLFLFSFCSLESGIVYVPFPTFTPRPVSFLFSMYFPH